MVQSIESNQFRYAFRGLFVSRILFFPPSPFSEGKSGAEFFEFSVLFCPGRVSQWRIGWSGEEEKKVDSVVFIHQVLAQRLGGVAFGWRERWSFGFDLITGLFCGKCEGKAVRLCDGVGAPLIHANDRSRRTGSLSVDQRRPSKDLNNTRVRVGRPIEKVCGGLYPHHVIEAKVN